MAILKRNADGKIITRDGKPSCTCCCVTVDCYGLWGPGYDTLPGSVFVANLTGVVLVDENVVHYRHLGGKCHWHSPSHNSQVFFGNGCMWFAVAHNVTSPYGSWIGHKKGAFTDGPLGQYVSNPDGLTGTIYYTVT